MKKLTTLKNINNGIMELNVEYYCQVKYVGISITNNPVFIEKENLILYTFIKESFKEQIHIDPGDCLILKIIPLNEWEKFSITKVFHIGNLGIIPDFSQFLVDNIPFDGNNI